MGHEFLAQCPVRILNGGKCLDRRPDGFFRPIPLIRCRHSSFDHDLDQSMNAERPCRRISIHKRKPAGLPRDLSKTKCVHHGDPKILSQC
jgi:hypothetical protein